MVQIITTLITTIMVVCIIVYYSNTQADTLAVSWRRQSVRKHHLEACRSNVGLRKKDDGYRASITGLVTMWTWQVPNWFFV